MIDVCSKFVVLRAAGVLDGVSYGCSGESSSIVVH